VGEMATAAAAAAAVGSDGAWYGWSFATSLSVGGRDKQTGMAVKVFPLRASISPEKNENLNASSNHNGTELGDGDDGDEDGDGGGGDGGAGGTYGAGDGGDAMDVDGAADPPPHPREPLHESGAVEKGRACEHTEGTVFCSFRCLSSLLRAGGKNCSLCGG